MKVFTQTFHCHDDKLLLYYGDKAFLRLPLVYLQNAKVYLDIKILYTLPYITGKGVNLCDYFTTLHHFSFNRINI